MPLQSLGQLAAVLLGLVLCLIVSKQNRRTYFAFLFILVYVIAHVANRLPQFFNVYSVLDLGLSYNWIGHLLMILVVLLFLWYGPLSAKDIGLTLDQRSDTVISAVIATLGVIIFKGSIAVSVNGGPTYDGPPFDSVAAEELLFQTIMAPVAQELLYTGVLLSLLIVALGEQKEDQTFSWNHVIVLAIALTAFSHGIRFGLIYDGGFQFTVESFLFPFIGKLVYAWLRLSTGSLLFPVIAFSLSNLATWALPYLLS